MIAQGTVSLKFRSFCCGARYSSLIANLAPKSSSEMEPKISLFHPSSSSFIPPSSLFYSCSAETSSNTISFLFVCPVFLSSVHVHTLRSSLKYLCCDTSALQQHLQFITVSAGSKTETAPRFFIIIHQSICKLPLVCIISFYAYSVSFDVLYTTASTATVWRDV